MNIMNILAGLNEEGVTIIMVTHSLETSSYARRKLVDSEITADDLKLQQKYPRFMNLYCRAL